MCLNLGLQFSAELRNLKSCRRKTRKKIKATKGDDEVGRLMEFEKTERIWTEFLYSSRAAANKVIKNHQKSTN